MPLSDLNESGVPMPRSGHAILLPLDKLGDKIGAGGRIRTFVATWAPVLQTGAIVHSATPAEMTPMEYSKTSQKRKPRSGCYGVFCALFNLLARLLKTSF